MFFQKYAPIIIFSGGFGALTKYLFDKPEAEIFAAEAIKLGVPEDRIFIENQSTNTGDNIIKSKKLIRDNNMAISSFIVVQKPYMLRQAYATFMKQWPEKYIVVSGPKISYESYPDNIITKELLINLLVGDTQRIRIYPERGFQISQDIPDKVWSAYQELVKRGFTKHLV